MYKCLFVHAFTLNIIMASDVSRSAFLNQHYRLLVKAAFEKVIKNLSIKYTSNIT